VIISSDPSSFATHISFLLAKIFRKKFILWGETWIWPKTIAARLIYPYVKFIVRHSDACIAAGSKSKEFFEGLGQKNVFIAPNCSLDPSEKVDMNRVDELRKKYHLSGKKVVLYIGRIVKYKGLDVLIKSYSHIEKEMDDTVLLVVGSGDYRPECESMVKKMGLHSVRFIDWVPADEVQNYYALSDVFVLPTRFRMEDIVPAESWGMTVNEAMHVGVPVLITTAVASGFDLVEDGVNGYMVKAGDADELYVRLRLVLSDKEIISRMRKESKKIVSERCTYDKMFEGFREAIEKVT